MEMSGPVFCSLAQIRLYIYSESCLVKNFCPPTHCMPALNVVHDLSCKAADLSALMNIKNSIIKIKNKAFPERMIEFHNKLHKVISYLHFQEAKDKLHCTDQVTKSPIDSMIIRGLPPIREMQNFA